MSSNPPANGSNPDEPDTSQMKAVQPEPDVVWPEDPFESDGRAADEHMPVASPEVTSPAIPAWPESQSGAPSTPPGHRQAAHPAPMEDDPHTTPFPALSPVASSPPIARADVEAADNHDNGTEDTKPPRARAEETLKTAPPAVAESEPEAKAEPEPEPAAAAEAPVEAEPAEVEPVAAEEPEPEPIKVEEAKEPEPEPEPGPIKVGEVEEPAHAAEVVAPPMAVETPEEAPKAAAVEEPGEPGEPGEPTPPAAPSKPAAPEVDRVAAEAAAAEAAFAASAATASVSNPPVPSWAPKLGGEPAQEKSVDWPGSNLPSWAPIASGPAAEPERVRITSSPAPTPAAQAPAPVQASAPPPAPATQASQPPPPPAAASQPAPAPASASKPPTSSSWEVVEQKRETAPAFQGPSPEDKSYAEWFAWAKRSGAPAGACHAAAQGAFRALSSGQDMATAVKWATIAMASPPGLVSQSRQLYCAWFSLGNIDLQLPTPTAHAFASGAIQALESGADSMVAHQMGLQAAGITAR